jgi:hypothetical protein
LLLVVPQAKVSRLFGPPPRLLLVAPWLPWRARSSFFCCFALLPTCLHASIDSLIEYRIDAMVRPVEGCACRLLLDALGHGMGPRPNFSGDSVMLIRYQVAFFKKSIQIVRATAIGGLDHPMQIELYLHNFFLSSFFWAPNLIT